MNQKTINLLEKWGIKDAAMAREWQPHKHTHHLYGTMDGISFPLYDLTGSIQTRDDGEPIRRWKNLDSEHDMKYAWLPNKPDNTLSLYFHPKVDDAISDAGGLVYFVEGEKDVLTMHEAGYHNIMSWFGGLNIPKDMTDIIKLLGVTSVIYLPDLDEIGRKSANMVAEMLDGAGIAYQAICLPPKLGKGGDVNDWWIDCKFRKEQFRTELQNHIENAILIDQAATLKTQRTQSERLYSNTGNTILPADFIRDVTQALQAGEPNRKGYARVHCPFHDDNNPSADWDIEKHILHCHACGETFLARDVGTHFGIQLRDYFDNNTSKDGKTTMTQTKVKSKNTKKQTPTDDEIGDSIITRWGDERILLYGKWYQYHDGVWNPVNDTDKAIWTAMKRFKKYNYRPSGGKAKSIQSYLEAQLSIPNDDGDKGHGVLNLQNGLLDIEMRVLKPHEKERYLTTQLPFAYDPDATCPRWHQFLNEVLVDSQGNTDEDLIALVQEAVGYSLTSDTRHEKMFWLHGQAATGKSTLLKAIKALLGTAAKELSLSTLQKNQYQLADIGGTRVITCSEAMSGSILADDHVKKLVSGEEIVARQIYHKPQRITPQCKLWWAMNELPQNLDRSEAIYRRLLLIPFRRPIPAEKRDLALFNKLTDELPGILNWALEGLERLHFNGHFTKVAQVDEAVVEYHQTNDTEALFLSDEEWIDEIGENVTRASDLYMAYKAYCERFGFEVKSAIKVAEDWKRLGLEKKRTSHANTYNVSLTPQAQKIVDTQRKKDGDKQ